MPHAQPGSARGTRCSAAAWAVIFDAVGNCSFENCKTALAPGGRLLLVVGSLGEMIGALLRPSRAGRKEGNVIVTLEDDLS